MDLDYYRAGGISQCCSYLDSALLTVIYFARTFLYGNLREPLWGAPSVGAYYAPYASTGVPICRRMQLLYAMNSLSLGPIYIDPSLPCIPKKNWCHTTVSHLFTDVGNLDGLHSFAASIGLRKCWFQSKARSRGMAHYDLSPKFRELALAAGATLLDRKQAVKKIREWRQFHTLKSSTP